MRLENTDLDAHIAELESYINSMRIDAEMALSRAEQDALAQLALMKQKMEDEQAALESERDAIDKELQASRALVDEMKATQEDVASEMAKINSTGVIGTGLRTKSCIVVWNRQSKTSCMPDDAELAAMQDMFDAERSSFARACPRLADAAKAETTCASCGQTTSEVALPVLVLGHQHGGMPTATSDTTTGDDIDMAALLALREKKLLKKPEIRSLSPQ